MPRRDALAVVCMRWFAAGLLLKSWRCGGMFAVIPRTPRAPVSLVGGVGSSPPKNVNMPGGITQIWWN
jgi:hypothetical protein